MPIKFGTTSISSIYKGNTKIDKIYKGLNLVYKSSLLPSGYIECEYLESTGTQYIDTGITSSSNLKITIDYMILGYSRGSDGTRASCVMRVSNSAGRVNIIPIINNRGNQMQFGWGNTYQNFSFTTNINQKYHAEIDNGVLTIDGTQVGSIPNTFSTQSNIEIFRLKADERVREYGCKMWDNDVLIRDLVPCLDNNGVPCMYDSVSKTTFYNAGTGEFTYKVKLPAEYTACEYLESTGTQYIDTNYYATNTSGINIDYAYTKSGNAGLCGIYQPTVPRTDTLFVTTLSGQTSTEIYLISQGGEATNYVVPVLETKYNGKINYLNNGKLIIDNVTKGNNGHNGVVSSRTIKLFCRDYNGNLAYTNARIYMCILTTGNTITRYLVPCLDRNGTPCMYDVVGKQTYYNAGSGTFNYG